MILAQLASWPNDTVVRLPMEIVELAWADEAWESYLATESTDPALYQSLSRVLVLLGRSERIEPELWARRLQGPALGVPALWAVPVRTRDADWLVLWDQAEDGCPQVHYIGPDPTV